MKAGGKKATNLGAVSEVRQKADSRTKANNTGATHSDHLNGAKRISLAI